jgi:hypothetical protein
MHLFKNTVLTWWQIGMFKYGVFGCGLLIGAYFHEFIWMFVWPIFIITLVCCVYVTYVWLSEHK